MCIWNLISELSHVWKSEGFLQTNQVISSSLKYKLSGLVKKNVLCYHYPHLCWSHNTEAVIGYLSYYTDSSTYNSYRSTGYFIFHLTERSQSVRSFIEIVYEPFFNMWWTMFYRFNTNHITFLLCLYFQPLQESELFGTVPWQIRVQSQEIYREHILVWLFTYFFQELDTAFRLTGTYIFFPTVYISS